MPWNPGLTKLQTLLANLYPDIQRAKEAVKKAGLPSGRIQFESAADSNWFNILEEADRQDVVGALVKQACEDAPNRCDELTDANNEYRELAAQLPAVSGPVSPTFPIFQVPYDRNPNFTGRGTYLDYLRINLTSGRPGARVQALTGLGGMGKTQLALEYAYRHQGDYQVIWWLSAEEHTMLTAEFARLATPLKLPQADLPDQREIVDAVCHWLARNDGWLLIFDDAGDRDSLGDYLPQSGTGHVLITSRNPAWRGTAHTSTVRPLQLGDAIAFLLQRTGQDNEAAASDLAEALGCLPLALEQAGAYIETTGIPLADYVTLFATRRAELWDHERPPAGYPDTVATTWSLAMEKVEAESPAATDLLRLCAFLAPEDIPRDLVTSAAEWLSEPLSGVVQDPLLLSQAVAALRRYSLLETGGDAWAMHRLVGTVVRDGLVTEAQQQWAAAAANLVNEEFPDYSDDVRTWPTCNRLLPHALAAAGHAEALAVAPEAAARLLNQAGLYLRGRAAYADAKTAFQRALAIGEASFGPDDPKVAPYFVNLGLVLQNLDDYDGARAAFERALAIDEAAYGPDHPEVGTDLNSLGNVLQVLGNPAGARAALERALTINEAAYGPDHPQVAVSLINLGRVLQDLGDYDGARTNFERALAIDEAAYGPDHPEVATDLGNLGSVLKNLGDYEAARAAYQRALAIDEAAYGPDHPQVATDVNSLGQVLKDLGDLAAARAAFERALAIREQILGQTHTDTATTLNDLGNLLQAEGDYTEARTYFERALSVYVAVFGDQNPSVATAHNNLGTVLLDLGDLAGARVAFERALSIDEASFGLDHPNVAAQVNNLSYLLEELGDLQGAHAAAARAYTIMEASLPAEHPQVQSARRHLEQLRQKFTEE